MVCVLARRIRSVSNGSAPQARGARRRVPHGPATNPSIESDGRASTMGKGRRLDREESPTPTFVPRLRNVEERERGVSSIELFFDLVFVFAFTQVTTFWLEHTSWGGLGRGLLVLLVLWWVWASYAWL